jgi:acetyl-CoA synthetase
MTGVNERISQWIREYAADQVDVANLMCDRHSGVALDYLDDKGNQSQYSFEKLSDLSRRCATALMELGVGVGDPVATLLPKSPELMITALGIWRLGAVHLPLFTAFGPDAISYRLQNSSAKVIVTDAIQQSKLAEPTLDRMVVNCTGERDFWTSIHRAAPVQANVARQNNDPLVVLYTSGTTGQPKGALLPVQALPAIVGYMQFGLDVREDDVFWNMADPGWAYGLYYALIGPLLLGHTTFFYNAPFNAEMTWRLLRERAVTNFAAAPTIYRALRAYAAEPAPADRLRLRVASSAGEPLNPEVIRWAEGAFGVPIHDHYGQTELGMLVMNHHDPSLARPLRTGSMGQATPGFRLTVVDREGVELGPGVDGTLAVDIEQSPLYWFRGYLNDPVATAHRIVNNRYYMTGDIASRDEDGFFYFSGRADDVITSAGYRIGPFEVESALVRHPAVTEAAVIGKPDGLRGEVVCAFVVLKPDTEPSDKLASELSNFVKSHLSAHAFPRDIRFVKSLPKTPSGKVQRYLLRSGQL